MSAGPYEYGHELGMPQAWSNSTYPKGELGPGGRLVACQDDDEIGAELEALHACAAKLGEAARVMRQGMLYGLVLTAGLLIAAVILLIAVVSGT